MVDEEVETVAARHFAAGAFDVLEDEDSEVEVSTPATATPRRGRHFKVPQVDEAAQSHPSPTPVEPWLLTDASQPVEIPDVSRIPEIAATPQAGTVPRIDDTPVARETPDIPLIPISSFAVPVSQDDDADALARARIEEILRELEMPPAPEPEPTPEPEPAPEPEPTPELDPLEAIDADSQMDEHPLGYDELDATANLGAARSGQETQDELETTAVIDYDAVRAAVKDQEPESEEPAAPIQRHERLEVGSGFYVPPNNSRSNTDSWFEEHKPKLSFFASIGEFFARLFHMDD